MRPASTLASRGSCLTNLKYGSTWLVASRSHMAAMSPVMMKLYGASGASVKATSVVSSVLGSVFLKRQASSVSLIALATRSIAASTAALTKRRCSAGGRRSMQGESRLPSAPTPTRAVAGWPSTTAARAASIAPMCRWRRPRGLSAAQT
eukprot:scaffold99950_cov63-Phaeocystis_antarctica.AAC.2